ncbi:MAG: murein hydrolase activator EnvC [Methylobacterium mesophilicum]|nr:murein hydrolase activator EnvC [Methylobacterium mesophilicum]
MRRIRQIGATVLALASLGLSVPAVQAADARAIAVQQSEYDRIAQEIALSDQRAAGLAAEIATVRKDSESLTAALVQSAAREREYGTEVEAIVARLEPLKVQEAGIKTSLLARREVLGEVLGALQRMGLNPPPAILVEPEDALASVRSAILLGAVVPGLKKETDKLVADLDALRQVANAIESERKALGDKVAAQLAEKRRLELLIEQKKRLSEENRAQLQTEQARSAALAQKAGSLKDLIAGLQAQADAEEKARQAREEREAKLASLPVPEANRLAPASPFAKLRRQVSLPVAGHVARRFGTDDGNGGVMLGDMVATQSGSIVTAPTDATVLYAGPFRSFGQLLILDAGDGYHLVLAGMDRINVVQGQPVVAGEPVGAMGETRVASIASFGTAGGPELYVEFRKDGKPVDPAPWWALGSGRTGNGT